MNNVRKFRGFAVLERPAGALVWGTFRPSEQEARAVFDKWNPPVSGFTPPAHVVAVEMRIFDK
jgi:hypothetical protein